MHKERFIDVLMKDPTISPEQKDELDGIPIVSCDEVAAFYYGSKQEYWSDHDFPCVAPPFPRFWLDFHPPSHVQTEQHGLKAWQPGMPMAWGCYCIAQDASMDLLDAPVLHQFKDELTWAMEQSRWMMQVHLDWCIRGQITPHVWTWHLFISEDGEFVRDTDQQAVTVHGPTNNEMFELISSLMRAESISFDEARDRCYRTILSYWHCAMLSLSFVNCKNIHLTEVTPPAPQLIRNKARKRRGDRPYWPVPYKVLNIEPMKRILKTEGQSDMVGAQRALHICHGHFHSYTEDRKLFGKYTGRFYIPMHARGSREKGVVTKDYNIKLS